MKSAKSFVFVILSGAFFLLVHHSIAFAFEFPRQPQSNSYTSKESDTSSVRTIRMRYSPEEQRSQVAGSAYGATSHDTQTVGESHAEYGVRSQDLWHRDSLPLSPGSASPKRTKINFHNRALPGNIQGQAFPAVASWYGGEFHGRRTASGETYDMHELTAAHRTLPFGTRVRVTNLRNGRQTFVRINDRGPFVSGRDIDLSYRAAQDLQMVGRGVEKVQLEIISG